MYLDEHMRRVMAFSRATFGPGARRRGVIDHIRKELAEIDENPDDGQPSSEWVDVVKLALDGLWRQLEAEGVPWRQIPRAICQMLNDKQSKNECRDWPDWRGVSADHAIEHVRPAGQADKCAGPNGTVLKPLGGAFPTCLVIGHGRHGKDTVGQMLSRITGRPYASSSEFCAQKAVYPLMSDIYPDWCACYDDRANHRDLWFHAIRAYNLRPGLTLAEQILQDHGTYVGMRSRAEFEAMRHLFGMVLWVDRSEHLPPEPEGSMELTADDADVVLDNNRCLEHLEAQIWAALYG